MESIMEYTKNFPNKIYHATTFEHFESIEKRILIHRKDANINLDFGKGFYTTTNISQAVKRAESLQRRLQNPRTRAVKEEHRGIVIAFDLNIELLYHNLGTDSYKIFDDADAKWAEFIVDNRTQNKHRIFKHNYDWSYGPMADGNCTFICKEYKRRDDLTQAQLLNGYFDEERGEEVKGLSPYRDDYDQLVFHNEELANCGVLTNPIYEKVRQNFHAR